MDLPIISGIKWYKASYSTNDQQRMENSLGAWHPREDSTGYGILSSKSHSYLQGEIMLAYYLAFALGDQHISTQMFAYLPNKSQTDSQHGKDSYTKF